MTNLSPQPRDDPRTIGVGAYSAERCRLCKYRAAFYTPRIFKKPTADGLFYDENQDGGAEEILRLMNRWWSV